MPVPASSRLLLATRTEPGGPVVPVVRHQGGAEQRPLDPAARREAVDGEAAEAGGGEEGAGEAVVHALPGDPDAAALAVVADHAARVIPHPRRVGCGIVHLGASPHIGLGSAPVTLRPRPGDIRPTLVDWPVRR